MKKVYKVYCEWDLYTEFGPQDDIVFTSVKKAKDWAITALKSAGVEDSYEELNNEGLVGIKSVKII